MPPSSYPTFESPADSIILDNSGLHMGAMDLSGLSGPVKPNPVVRTRYDLENKDIYPVEDNGGPSRAKAYKFRLYVSTMARKLASYAAKIGRFAVGASEENPEQDEIPVHDGSAEGTREGVTVLPKGDPNPQTVEGFEKALGELPWSSASVSLGTVEQAVGVQVGRDDGYERELRADIQDIIGKIVSLEVDSYEGEDGPEGNGEGHRDDRSDTNDDELEAEPVVINLVNSLDGDGDAYLETVEGDGSQEHDVSYCGARFSR